MGGPAEQQSLHFALEYGVQGWLRQSPPGLTAREEETLAGRLRKALRNVNDLLKHLRTAEASIYAERVEQDLQRFGPVIEIRTALHSGNIEHRLLLYRHELMQLLSFDVPVGRKIRLEIGERMETSRFEGWLRTVAGIWATSELKLDMGLPFRSYVALCWPDPHRCEAAGLKRPKPLADRAIVDWISNLRQARRQKL